MSLGKLRLRRTASLVAALATALLAVGCGSSVDSQLDEIRALQEAGQFDPSIAPLRRLLADHADHAEANYRLGIALRQTGRPSLAVWPLQKAAENEDYAVQSGLLLASTLSANGAHEESIRASSKVLAVEAENIVALHARGQAYLASGQPEKALGDADTVLALRADDHNAALLRGSALLDLDRPEEAEQTLVDLADMAAKSGNANDAARKCAALATFYRSQDDNVKAKATYGRCLEANPSHPLLQQWVADFYVSTGEPLLAVELWQNAVKATPEDLGLRAKLANLQQQAGQTEEAKQTLLEAVELFDTPQAWRMLASFHRRAGDPKAAREALEQAMDRTRSVSAPMRFALADMLIEEGEYERAQSIADSLEEPAYKYLLQGAILLKQDDPKGALERFDQGLRLWPSNAGARYLAGTAAHQLGDRTRALAEYREAVRVGEEETDAALRLAELHFTQGEFLLAQQFAERHIRKRPFVDSQPHVIAARSAMALGRYERAETLLNTLRSRAPDDPTAYVEFAEVKRRTDGPEVSLGIVLESDLDLARAENADALRSVATDLLALGRAEEARKRVTAAAAANPDSADLMDLKGRVLLRMGRTDEASAAFARSLEIDPGFAPALEASGTLARNAGDLAGALAFYDKAIDADPDRGNYPYLSAQIKLMQGNNDEATALLEKALEVEPAHAGANNDLAWMLASAGVELERALSLAQRAVLVERSADTLDTLGYVHLQKGDAAEAVSVLGKALEERPESPSIEYRLGMALAAQGDKDGARAALTNALTRPTFPEADAARAELAKLSDS